MKSNDVIYILHVSVGITQANSGDGTHPNIESEFMGNSKIHLIALKKKTVWCICRMFYVNLHEGHQDFQLSL